MWVCEPLQRWNSYSALLPAAWTGYLHGVPALELGRVVSGSIDQNDAAVSNPMVFFR
jgi:hypothetical protein